MTDKQIIENFMQYVGDDIYATWYVGIASNPEARLFSEHRVNKLTDKWIYSGALDELHARSAESVLLNYYGFDGGVGGGDNNTRYVYAYKKTILHSR